MTFCGGCPTLALRIVVVTCVHSNRNDHVDVLVNVHVYEHVHVFTRPKARTAAFLTPCFSGSVAFRTQKYPHFFRALRRPSIFFDGAPILLLGSVAVCRRDLKRKTSIAPKDSIV
jgi:hypothetical protein